MWSQGPNRAKAIGRREPDIRHQEKAHSPAQELAASCLYLLFLCLGTEEEDLPGSKQRVAQLGLEMASGDQG